MNKRELKKNLIITDFGVGSFSYHGMLGLSTVALTCAAQNLAKMQL